MKWILFGTGKRAKRIYESNFYQFSYAIDNEKAKWSTLAFQNLKVFPPDYIKSEKDKFKIIIASKFYLEIKDQLERLGLVEGIDFGEAIADKKHKMISVFDTSICDNNLGNQIIMDSVYEIIRQIFPDYFLIKLPYLDLIGKESITYIRKSQYTIFGGTNSLSSHMKEYSQWGIDENNAKEIDNVTLLGMGWWKYQEDSDEYTKALLKQVLSSKMIHSVRDSYTYSMLKRSGNFNIVNTGCPTLWGLDNEHCAKISREKAENVVMTFTEYNRSPLDWKLAKMVEKYYKTVFVWRQGPTDGEYARQLFQEIELINPNLEAYDTFLENHEVDYIGTRLHAGIRALQKGKRSLIISIDNRAIEMGKDFELPIAMPDDYERIQNFIVKDYFCDIKVPFDNIELWKKQFERK